MRRLTALAMLTAIAVVAVAAQAEWKMGVYHDGHVTEYILSEVDSFTFYNDSPPPPPMVTVPAGSFVMGDGTAYNGVDEREITLTRGFLLGQHEVTVEEYRLVLQWAFEKGYVTVDGDRVRDTLDGSTVSLLDMDDDPGGHHEDPQIYFDSTPDSFKLTSPAVADHPVMMVSWFGAARYCDWLSLQQALPRAYEHTGDWLCNGGDPYGAEGFRLPTDAEWEYAAQYDDERFYPWGNESPDCNRVNYWPNSPCVGWTSPVGSYPPAPAALGLSDMAGNVWEWCNDWHACNLGPDPATDPTGPGSGSYRLLRGESWSGSDDDGLRCASRRYSSPYRTDFFYGFRIARTAE